MKTCPACHRTVPGDAEFCPHAGCGRPLAPAAGAKTKKRPPPPGKVHLSPVGPSTPERRTDARGGRGRGNPSATILLVLLLLLLLGGIYYAAVLSKSSQPQPEHEIAAGTNQPPTKAPDVARPEQRKQPSEIAPPSVSAHGKDVAGPRGGEIAKDDEPKNENKVDVKLAATAPSQPLGLYGERTRPDRASWIATVGGTPLSEQAVAAGLEWLTRHQAEDGHWGSDCLGSGGLCCEKEHPCGGAAGGKYEAAQTGLALLAFQASGNYDFNDKPNSEQVRRGLDWLVARQGPNGELLGSASHYLPGDRDPVRYDQRFMYEHAIATFALGEACAVARAMNRHPDKKYESAAIKAIQFIENQQHDDGGWRYTTQKSNLGDASVSGWVMLALKTAKEAQLPMNDATIARMRAFFKRLADPLTGRTHYQGTAYVTDATTGVGMMVEEFVGKQPHSELLRFGAPYLADQAEMDWGGAKKQTGDYYLWYNCTLAMFLVGGKDWDRWNHVIRDHVISLQTHGDQCDRGSFSPDDRWGATGGRIYSTALALLTLEVYYRFDRDTLDGDAP